MARKISTGVSTVTAWDVASAKEDLHAWLTAMAKQHGLTWLLAQCEDGTIWGVMQDGKLLLSSDAFPQEYPQLRLRWEALTQARLFGPPGELLLWLGPAGWRARYRDDSAGTDTDYINERQLLWGTWSDEEDRTVAPFTLLVEGRQGIQHAPPLAGQMLANTNAQLWTRHYLADDTHTGLSQIVDSRLVAVEPPGGQP
ncbi:TIGR03984 family CRISPR-associated protein [Oscillochloris sp. ZM17-4]|uniref:type III-D CRISPR-associated protein Csx19 n=1 Tax=Oscillochloris sp. ZM17-4 TaxID=2866714 RepID=UPI001C73A56C|nr:CRISPR-associated protein Csx19 [Oscillochloris sp. ZM17-4]MBX0331375.1 TIGR03984 family CRISPR-associated protein [Oscillochloris sp. ZM17-4]